MYDLAHRIDLEIEKHSLLKHKFYQLWSEGKLNIHHLQGYSKEYFELVKAVPTLVQNIFLHTNNANSLAYEINQNLNEESDHIQLWIKFASSIGVNTDELLNHICADGTNKAINSLVQLTRLSLAQGAAAMYAYEMQLPEISRSKIEGLRRFYGINNDPDATKYFEVHKEVDIRHAALWRSIILQRACPENSETLFNAASQSLDAQNSLLDSVYQRYIGSMACC